VEPHRREVPHALELKENFDEPGIAARPIRAVVPPADPLVALVAPAVWIEPEVVVTLDAVCKLPESAAEVVVSDATVVGVVVQVNLGASSLALRHVVRQHAICVSPPHYHMHYRQLSIFSVQRHIFRRRPCYGLQWEGSPLTQDGLQCYPEDFLKLGAKLCILGDCWLALTL